MERGRLDHIAHEATPDHSDIEGSPEPGRALRGRALIRRWVIATSAGAALAYAIAMLSSTLGAAMDAPRGVTALMLATNDRSH
ncbi:MAG: hypothetical protein ACRDWY_12135 [Actinomycetes bacterium]